MAEDLLVVTCAAFVSSLGAFLFGLDVGYIAPILECAEFKRDVAHLPDWNISYSQIPAREVGFIVSIFSLGCILMSLPMVSSYFMDTWGRRSSIIIGSPIFLLGSFLQARAYSYAVMCLGRFISGCAVGLLASVVPLYQSEVAPARLRGALTTTYQLMLAAGIFVAAYLDWMLLERTGGWRTAIWLQTIPAGMILCTMPFMPRSPRWLVKQGRLQEAQDVLERIRGPEEAKAEYQGIVESVEFDKRLGEPLWSEVFSGRVGKLVTVGASLQLLQQFVGMNAFMYFGPRIFSSFGVSGVMFQTAANGVNLLFTVPAVFLADCAGRRILLVIGGIGMFGSCVALGVLGRINMHRIGDFWDWDYVNLSVAMIACIFLFIMNFACTWGPMVWLYCCEIFPLKYRGRCVGVTTTANWIGNFFIAQLTPVALDTIGFSTFFIFGFFSLCAVLLALWLPETKGLVLEDIGRVFDERFGEEEKCFGAGLGGAKATYGSAGALEDKAA